MQGVVRLVDLFLHIFLQCACAQLAFCACRRNSEGHAIDQREQFLALTQRRILPIRLFLALAMSYFYVVDLKLLVLWLEETRSNSRR